MSNPQPSKAARREQSKRARAAFLSKTFTEGEVSRMPQGEATAIRRNRLFNPVLREYLPFRGRA
jgi:hypothetical protein